MLELKETSDTIIFTPVAGWTTKRAIAYSIDMAISRKKTVRLNMNDIVLEITKKSNLLDTNNLYLKLLNEKYENAK